MLTIKKDENVFISRIRDAKDMGKRVYIIGAALGAVRIAGGLQYRGVDFDGFVVDKEYYKEGQKLLDKGITCLDDVVGDRSVLICSIANYPKMEELKEKVEVIDEDVQSLWMVASDPFDLDYVNNNIAAFNKLYNALSDDKSKQVMTAFINQKLTGRFEEMKDVWDVLQYFDGDFYDLTKVRSIVDCGAYIGDSFLSFCEEYERRTGHSYTGIAYLFDPDERNQLAIQESCKHSLADVRGIQVGAWDEDGVLFFQSDENYRNAGRIDETGNKSIKVNAIDNIVEGDSVDFIKMDIEGAELHALRGAKQTIVKCHPTLAICVYHKREDMIEISEYIRNLYSNYHFYLRAYGGPYSIELVLFAVA